MNDKDQKINQEKAAALLEKLLFAIDSPLNDAKHFTQLSSEIRFDDPANDPRFGAYRRKSIIETALKLIDCYPFISAEWELDFEADHLLPGGWIKLTKKSDSYLRLEAEPPMPEEKVLTPDEKRSNIAHEMYLQNLRREDARRGTAHNLEIKALEAQLRYYEGKLRSAEKNHD